MDTLAARIRWIVAHRFAGSQRALSIKAGLRGTYVNTTLERLDTNPNTDVGGKTLNALATAGGVDVKWLLTGEGQPTADSVVVKNERYPNRAIADEMAEKAGIDKEARENIHATAYESAESLSVLEWFDLIRGEAQRLKFTRKDPAGAARQREIELASADQDAEDDRPNLDGDDEPPAKPPSSPRKGRK